jgi:hypothetical protein
MKAIYTKTWVYTRDGIELRCYMASPTVGALGRDAKIAAKEMGLITENSPVPKELRLGDNKHGSYLHARFEMTRDAIENLRPKLKELGWAEGKSAW